MIFYTFCSQTLRKNSVFPATLKVFRTPWTRHPGLPATSRLIHVDRPPIVPSLTTSYAHGTSSMSLLGDTVGGALLKSVERWPDKEALAFLEDGVRKTFAEFLKDVDQAAAGLLALGLRKGDRLGIRQPGMFHFDDVMQAASSQFTQQLQELQKKISFDEPINIQFTSGTTGAPKGATLSHHNIINNAFFVGRRMGYDWRLNTRICLPVPLYHCFGSVGGGIIMAVYGCTLVFPSAGYNGKSNLAALESERCTFIYGTPTMYVDMLAQPDLAKYDLSSLEGGIMAGSPCPAELVNKVVSSMGIKGLTIGYGTTENSPVTFLASPMDNMERKCETVGYIMEHLEAKIVDPTTGEVLPLGMKGEIMVRGYCVMLEYWGDPCKTSECITKDGWYKTGDIGSMDAYSYLKIDGRSKDMIIRGGENVYPAEIEQFLHTHPKVKEAQVVGVEDVRMGEEVCACIKLVDGQESSPEEIKAFCKGQISHFKIPRYVLFVTDYPVTITGKIQKHKLREEAEKQLGLKRK
uniref:Medium-chain acyl-CoA ligase ACSF2, mitochondrial n=1 Tax=Nothobranchius kuhntae TaxID=321403 RepID=A0A1A8IX70_NOTKU